MSQIDASVQVMRIASLLCVALASAAAAQVPLTAETRPATSAVFDAPARDSLHCSFRRGDTFLDFAFRYNAGYWVLAPLAQFTPGETLQSFVRVNPQSGQPLLMHDSFEVASVPSDVARHLGPKELKKIDLEMSVGFALGEGRYTVDAVVLDQKGRSCRHRWIFETHKSTKPGASLSLPPNTATPLDSWGWDGKLADKSRGVRLTVLLDAVPMNRRMSKLYAWDRAFLLQSLASLLKQMPVESVRVVAFNLDQQRELFRQDSFDVEGFGHLSDALRKLENATISYKALQRRAWADFLVHLAQEQAQSSTAGLVVFIGPSTRTWDRIPKEMLSDIPTSPSQFVYLEYFPWFGAEYPDPIEYLTQDLHGTVYRFHSAEQFRQSVQKMLLKVRPTRASAPAAHDTEALPSSSISIGAK